MKKLIIFILTLNLYLLSCGKEERRTTGDSDSTKKKDKIESAGDISDKPKEYSLNDFLKKDRLLDELTEKIFRNLVSDEEKVAQMVVTFGGKSGKPDAYVKKVIKEKKAGGVILLGGTREYMKEMISSLNKIIDSLCYLPLLHMTDAEPSLLSKKIGGLPDFKSASAITKSEISGIAENISLLIKEIGFNMNLAPVCDFPDNKEIIGKRSFGNKTRIIELAVPFIRETQKENIIATAKHFPGHGKVKGDSHKGLVYLENNIDEEIQVFKSVINEGVMSIMVGHIAVKEGKYSTEGLPATLSKKIVTDVLKGELEFKGLVITDAMNMEAVSKRTKPSLNAVIAGNDLILAPSDEGMLISSVVEKMETDETFKQNIYKSVKKIIRIKICLGLIKI
ncbi:MAG: glycoside hydrolase family 3 protein [Ignavibacteria bacterium]|nr:glycoside hydrolase family 3 protein [Ignavibacteria bacterium]